MKSKIIVIVISLVALVSFSACQKLDVVGNVAKTSFADVLAAIPEQIEPDDMNKGWSLNAPDQTARFIWSEDYSKSPTHDVMLEFDAKPFMEAGLDINKLESGIVVGDKIMLGAKLGKEQLKYKGKITPEASFNKIVELHRASIGYHEALDHYGVDLGNGNKFEWAKDMNKNDKDIVFVVDPEIFIKAGVNPEQVKGWVYASVKMKDSSGKPIEVKKFLKPFDLTSKAQ
ncbi:MAG: hypothetical protein PHX08_10270 [Lachnospiraceae bacterium]|nr:hypothetical protein [Lachnospiraceae bacterium]